jgi:hypothetical protein
MGHSKGGPKGKFIAMNAHIKNTERSQVNNRMLHIKPLEKEEKVNLQASRRKQIIKIRAKTNEIETKKNQ